MAYFDDDFLDPDNFENKLEYTEIHKKYQELFES